MSTKSLKGSKEDPMRRRETLDLVQNFYRIEDEKTRQSFAEAIKRAADASQLGIEMDIPPSIHRLN